MNAGLLSDRVVALAMVTVLLHNPQCSKSRQAKAWLNEAGHAYVERLYLDEPLSSDELRGLIAQLDGPATELVRTKEALFRDLPHTAADLDEALVIALITEHPRLMERPIVVHHRRAAIGRPTERISALFE